MAGSKSWFKYTDDSGADFSVNLDESNSEASVGTERLFLNRTAAHPLLRKGTKLRYVNAFLVTNPVIKRRFYVGNPLAVPEILGGSSLTAAVYNLPTDDAAPVVLTWTITSYRGEQTSIPPNVSTTSGDTGLTDNDPGRDA